MDKINIDEIKIEFGGKHPPKDEKLIGLLKDAYQCKLGCRTALIKTEFIKPFSDYVPNVSDEYKKWFLDRLEIKDYPKILVYQESNHFIMSDDYNAYYMYLSLGFNTMWCTILGTGTGDGVLTISEPFNLNPPVLQVINK